MKLSKWSLVGIINGFLFSLFSSIRYFIMYPDLDRAIVYVIIGFLIMCVSWNYQVNFEQNKSILAIENYLSDKNNKEKK